MKLNTISNNVPAIQNKNDFTQESIQPKRVQVKNGSVNNESRHMAVKEYKDDVKSTVEKLNDFIDPIRTNLKFVFHEDLHEYYVTVVNPLTDEVIREIPPKKMLDMYAAMTEYMGLLVDEKI